jgi:hypothetical protein
MGIERPHGAQRFVVSATEPIAETVAKNGADYGNSCHPPWIEHMKADEDAGCDDYRTSWDDGADHGHRLQQGRGEHHGECQSGVLREEVDQGLPQLTLPAAFESL